MKGRECLIPNIQNDTVMPNERGLVGTSKAYPNAGELHKCLKTVMVRRLKSDVLQDLPPKQRSIIPVTILDKEKERESRETMKALGMAREAVNHISDLDADDVANSANWEARKLLMQGM